MTGRQVAGRTLRGVRIALGTVRYLVTIRRAFPLPLRVLLVIGAVQTPLPLDEACALIAAGWLLLRYRPTLRVAWRAAQSDI